MEQPEAKTMNQRLMETARSRWVAHVAVIDGGYQGQADHYSRGNLTKTEKCTHKHETAIAAAACAEKLSKK